MDKQDPQPAKWSFDPMQPGDHEPVSLPEGMPDAPEKQPRKRPDPPPEAE
jgi:hypothetical protein